MNRTISLSIVMIAAWTTCFLLGNSPVEAATATTTTLTSSVNPVAIGQQVTYTVTVTASGSLPLTGPVRITYNGNYGPDYSLHNGSVVVTSAVSGPPRTLQIIASYTAAHN